MESGIIEKRRLGKIGCTQNSWCIIETGEPKSMQWYAIKTLRYTITLLTALKRLSTQHRIRSFAIKWCFVYPPYLSF